MAEVYDNWERLVRATLRREQLRQSAFRTPSDVSSASSSAPSSAPSPINFASPSAQLVSSFKTSSSLPLVGKSFTYHQILQATDYLSSSNFIKHGRSGDLFHGVLEGCLQVVVKKVDLSMSSSGEKESYLLAELEFLDKVSHARFVPFLGHCFEKANDKFLVYKCMPNKDLSSSLCSRSIVSDGTNPDSQKSTSLDWVTRLKIAVGVAEGATNAMCAYDVYCFGKVLLELVTGNPGLGDGYDSRIKEWMENVLPYITTYDKELLLNIMDPCLVVDEHVLIEVWAVAVVAKACLSPKPLERPQMACILKALEDPMSVRLSTYETLRIDAQLGLVCSALVSTRMTEGVSVLGTSQANANRTSSNNNIVVSNSRSSAAGGTEETNPHGVIWDLPNLRIYSLSELKAATNNFRSDRVLGESEFGRVYKGWLHEKSTSKTGSQSLVAVQKLKAESLQGFVEWKTEICMLGTLSHPNLIKLLGYCWKGKDMLLVYEYMQKGSFDNHLFGRGSSIQPLQWDARLKILIGAARALAFLHAVKKQVIYRVFKASNILLDASYNAKLSNFGLAKIGPLNGQLNVTIQAGRTLGYAAPEYIRTGQLCVKSDVYGFGVVLAEVLTGLRALDTCRPKGKHYLFNWIKCQLFDKTKIEGVMDSRLEGKYPIKAAVGVAKLAQNCLAFDPKARPSMKQVVDALEHIIASVNY
ncbi:probable serine/threonine-protein kinase PIX13 [Coffea eugenioides]|uniref:probable serine/threonine-protein kinase PIX13 n=1 Tax=Coffea eugenioides TaxID=49369 RepID=UPI000F609B8E|nr:probable serine/threonine-protein kinase PIX13 [Coffea eugenioides]